MKLPLFPGLKYLLNTAVYMIIWPDMLLIKMLMKIRNQAYESKE